MAWKRCWRSPGCWRPLTYRLRPLVDEWNAIGMYEDREWTALRDALDVGLPELNAIVAEVCGDRFRLPSYCATAWRAFTHLACRNALPGALPPSMELLEHLALHTEMASHVGELHAWNEHFAELWGCGRGRAGSPPSGPPGRGRAVDAAVPTAAAAYAEACGQGPGRPVIRLYVKVARDLAPVDGKSRRAGRREPATGSPRGCGTPSPRRCTRNRTASRKSRFRAAGCRWPSRSC
ncbi:hypothetical protein NKH77_19330 [Streptomyces sp. M19]